MATINNVTDLIVNKVESQEVFNYMKQNGLVKDDELYIIEGNDAAVLHTPQTLTEEQKAQVRANIGAVASGDLKVATTDTNGLMSSVDKTKLDSIPQGAQANVQADWSVNDETSDAYVQNRTHWAAVEHKVWFDNETVAFEEWNGTFLSQIMTEEQILIVGQTYNVVIDTESYERVAYEFEGTVCLGNLSIMDTSLTNTNESFFIYSPLPEGASVMSADVNFMVVATSLSGASHTVTLSADVTVYHKIDENYLPAIIGRPGERVGSEVFNDYINNFAGGAYAHAEGFSTFASGHASHAEGEMTKATFENAHAEGCNTVASGSQSHAEGEGTIADGRNQHVQGKYNIEDTADKYAHIVGNGTKDSDRSNAHTIDWDGTAWFKGSVKVGGTGQDDASAKTLATTDIATTENNGLMSAIDKAKLDGVEQNANNYVLPTASETVVGGVMVGENLTITDGMLAAKDTTYEAATTTVGGLMSAADKFKLDGIAEGANNITVDTEISDSSINPVQNKVVKSYVDTKVAGIVESAPETLNTLNELAAALGDDPNFATTVATQSGTTVDKVDGKGLSTNDYTTAEKEKLAGITTVTTSQDGLMSAADKSKLDGIEENANNYVHPTTSGNKHIPSGGTSNQVLKWSEDGTAIWGDDKDTTYDVATSNTNGLMSSEDKAKLDAVPAPENIVTTTTIFDSIIMKDQVNGMNYIVCMRNGNLVSYSKAIDITLAVPPTKMSYMEGEYLDTTGMVVNAICEDGGTREITDYTCDNYVTMNNPAFTIAYVENDVEYTLTIDVTVTEFDETILQDFTYEKQNDGTYLITDWKGTVNGVESPEEMVVPNNGLIVI